MLIYVRARVSASESEQHRLELDAVQDDGEEFKFIVDVFHFCFSAAAEVPFHISLEQQIKFRRNESSAPSENDRHLELLRKGKPQSQPEIRRANFGVEESNEQPSEEDERTNKLAKVITSTSADNMTATATPSTSQTCTTRKSRGFSIRNWAANRMAASRAELCCAILLVTFCASILLGAGPIQCQQETTMELHRRVKRALYDLPGGAELILGPNVRTSFSCDGLGYGYYADQDNDCKIFHVCQSFKMSDGSIYHNHWSFLCGNQTVFNQVSLACSHPEDAIPCESSREFYHVNDYFGDLAAPSVRDADLGQAQELISRTYGSRLSAAANAS